MTRLAPTLSLLLMAAAPSALPVEAQIASLVADLNDDESGFGYGQPSSYPGRFVPLPGSVVFIASEPSAGAELWGTDGTAHGTELLADICPGGCSSEPWPLGAAGGVSWWSVEEEDPRYERSLWRSDGTRAGTYSLAPGVTVPDPSFSSDEKAFAVVRNRLFFVGCAPGGCELWRSDGTPAGTRPVGVAPRELTSFTPVGDKLFFVGRRDSNPELWVSDGTAQGTSSVGEFDFYSPSTFAAVGNRLFFIAPAEGAPPFSDLEIWVSDGTTTGTHQVSQLTPDSALASTRWLKPVGGFVYFVADDVIHGQEIWRSDGTATGTRRVTEFGYHLPIGQGYGSDVDPRSWEELDGKLLFVATDGLTSPKLWTTNGDPASTAPLVDACAGGCPNAYFIGRLLKVGRRVYFPASDDDHGAELWATDGTVAGTAMVRDVCPGPCSGFVSGAMLVGGKVLFVGTLGAIGYPFSRQLWRTDGTPGGTRPFSELLPGLQLNESVIETVALGKDVLFPATGPQGTELWASDGRPGGTRLVRDLAVGPPAADPHQLAPLGNLLLFRACEGRSAPLWRTAGTAEATFPLVADLDFSCFSGYGPSPSINANNLLFFFENSFSGPELWRTDGTPEGTVLLVRFAHEVDLERTRLAALGGTAYFNIGYHFSGPPRPDEIWKSDGTAEGTGLAIDLGGDTLHIFQLSAAGGALFFAGYHQDEGPQLWRSNGTGVGTQKLRSGDLTVPAPSFIAVGPLVYFIAEETNVYLGSLWVTNGTAGGTRKVLDLSPYFYANSVQLISFRGALYFFASVAGEYGLWTTDGTGTGTHMIHAFRFEDPTSQPVTPDAVVVGERLFFRASDGTSGRELWSSDGTATNTRVVTDIVPGPGSSDPRGLTAAGGKLFFAAHDVVHGVELWNSDGTAAGTRLIHDIAPGAASSAPEQLTVAGTRLYFSADDGLSGRELWSLELSAPAGVCVPSPTALCLGGRFQVRAAWKDFARNTGVGKTVPLTADTGAFWFFGPDNVEVILKVLDGRPLNEHHWVFYGALSSVEYALTVTDVQTGLTARYLNPEGQLASVADTTGFGPLGAFSVVEPSTSGTPPRARTEWIAAAATAPCVPGPQRLCLSGGRFAVEATWKDFSGHAGLGTAVTLTGDTGYFWFFGADNVEVVLKVLDGRPVNGKHWVFYGALSSVEYTLRVTDTATGKVKTYTNPSGNLASVADTGAF